MDATRSGWPVWCLVALPLLAVVGVGGFNGLHRTAAARFSPALERWEMADLVEHLRASGMEFRVLRTAQEGAPEHNLILTQTDAGWVELQSQPKAVERIEHWRGSLYCEKLANPDGRTVQLELWAGCAFQAGPFVFFGDAEMLAQARVALRAVP